MATSAEQTFHAAVAGAENVRQNARASAATTYGFVKANYAAYVTALIAADVAFINSIVSAASTAGLSVMPSLNGPIAHSNWCKIGSS